MPDEQDRRRAAVAQSMGPMISVTIDSPRQDIGPHWDDLVRRALERSPLQVFSDVGSEIGQYQSELLARPDAAGDPESLPDIGPLRPRAFLGEDGTQYALAPIGDTNLAILVARTAAPQFHRTEVFRLAQLVGAAEAVLGDRLAQMAAAVDLVV